MSHQQQAANISALTGRTKIRWTPWLWCGLAILAFLIWYFTGYPRGMFIAYVDYLQGHQEIKICGVISPDEPELARLLRTRYSVEVSAIDSTFMTQEHADYLAGYNAVSRYLLLKKYGKDVVGECESEALGTGGTK